MNRLIATLAAFGLASGPALAASGDYGFFSLRNTDFIVLLSFLAFIGVLVYFKVPALLGGLLDKRAEAIRADLDQARRLREEAQEIYASYERRQREVHVGQQPRPGGDDLGQPVHGIHRPVSVGQSGEGGTVPRPGRRPRCRADDRSPGCRCPPEARRSVPARVPDRGSPARAVALCGSRRRCAAGSRPHRGRR